MPKILVLDSLSEEGVEVFRQTDGIEVDVKPPQKPDELAAIIGEYDGLVVRSGTKVTGPVIEKADNLKVIGRAGVGTDNIDKDAATKRGIVVMNVPGGNTISTCEHAFALLFALCRNVPKAHVSMMEGKWDRKKFMGTEVRGKTLGVVGVGRIGAEVSKRAKTFEMRVLGYDPILTKLKAEALGVELVSFNELIEQSDIITVHAPKSEKTKNLIAAEQFKRMKPHCLVINCARGGIVNEQDLAEALKQGVIGGAALDVYTSEPFEDNPFIGLDNIVTTPHLAASTGEAQQIVAVEMAEQMLEYLTTGAIINAVNVPSLDSETRKELQPLLELGERLGRFMTVYADGPPSAINIEYEGDVGVADTYPVTAAILTGFLKPLVEMVNMVSAPSLLREHGIDFSETRSARPCDYAFEVKVGVATENKSHEVVGTLFNNEEPRICSIDGVRLDLKPEGHMLVYRNEDKPLALARVTTAIGEAGVNIANLALGRDVPGGMATTVLTLDGPLSEEVLGEIRSLPHVQDARLVAVEP